MEMSYLPFRREGSVLMFEERSLATFYDNHTLQSIVFALNSADPRLFKEIVDGEEGTEERQEPDSEA